MAKCDLCNGACEAVNLALLDDIYQAAGVKEVCPSCLRSTDKQLEAARTTVASTVRAKIAERVGPRPGLIARAIQLLRIP